MALVAFVVAATEGQGWFGSIDGADAQRTTASGSAAKPNAARSLPLCPPKFRRGGGGVTCITDGDSGVANGEPWRLTTRSGGVDAPEVGRPECAAERTVGDRATRRLQSLMSGGYTMSGGSTDRHGRRLVTVTLADGRDAGQVLIDEGLAQPWPNLGNPWC
ncbi:thermonuclease family protein [Aureimonas sp. SA4125]|uniref:thermonuclease family protein n=1 Tax=Aureimonas sp. SA4125 TaxID=2826993 RepID=UPI001CC3E74F|nr:thermonuclease family protein [Aureimonas sp. SA4125]